MKSLKCSWRNRSFYYWNIRYSLQWIYFTSSFILLQKMLEGKKRKKRKQRIYDVWKVILSCFLSIPYFRINERKITFFTFQKKNITLIDIWNFIDTLQLLQIHILSSTISEFDDEKNRKFEFNRKLSRKN